MSEELRLQVWLLSAILCKCNRSRRAPLEHKWLFIREIGHKFKHAVINYQHNINFPQQTIITFCRFLQRFKGICLIVVSCSSRNSKSSCIHIETSYQIMNLTYKCKRLTIMEISVKSPSWDTLGQVCAAAEVRLGWLTTLHCLVYSPTSVNCTVSHVRGKLNNTFNF